MNNNQKQREDKNKESDVKTVAAQVANTFVISLLFWLQLLCLSL